MKWVKINLNLERGGNQMFQYPPRCRDVVSVILGDGIPELFQRDSSGSLLSTPPTIFYGGWRNTLTLKAIGDESINVIQKHMFDISKGVAERFKQTPKLEIIAGEYPDELQISQSLITYKIARLIVSTRSKKTKAIWFGGQAKEYAADTVRDYFYTRLSELGIDIPDELVFGDVKFKRTVPISQGGYHRIALCNVSFRTNAHLNLQSGTPWNIGKLTSLGYGTITHGGLS